MSDVMSIKKLLLRPSYECWGSKTYYTRGLYIHKHIAHDSNLLSKGNKNIHFGLYNKVAFRTNLSWWPLNHYGWCETSKSGFFGTRINQRPRYMYDLVCNYHFRWRNFIISLPFRRHEIRLFRKVNLILISW